MSVSALFGGPRPAFVGVVHLLATPGAPRYAGSLEALLARAAADAQALVNGGVDALLVENFGDAPFFAASVPSETVAALALALYEVRGVAGELPVGVNVLRNDARAALGLCASSGAEFLRVNVHTGAMVTDQGLIQGRAAETLRERARLCPEARLWADVHVKHATPLGRETLLEAALDAAQRGLADALILSGSRTGVAPAPEPFLAVRERVGECPLLVGSGLDEHNARALLAVADGALVGTALERDGQSGEPVEEQRVARLRACFDAAARRQ
ncbi:MAG: BtpA/SgcQ family protein [Planctomycetes bacterium]|nr:BtpA/SgcQ family protein [Planctomycetota bacterium]